jgi:hypothetical protein
VIDISTLNRNNEAKQAQADRNERWLRSVVEVWRTSINLVGYCDLLCELYNNCAWAVYEKPISHFQRTERQQPSAGIPHRTLDLMLLMH